MPQVKIVVEYDGAGFHGYQKQPGLRTVQSELERVLTMVCREPVTSLRAAGRTDSGVHARGQVVVFNLANPPELRRIVAGVSNILKNELSVVSAEIVPDSFHPGIDCTHKQYSYRIMNRPAPAVLDARRVWHIGPFLDVDVMREEARVLIGTHDFSGFRDSECCAKSPIKTIYSISIERSNDMIEIKVIGTGFLKQMVRNIVGTLVDIARKRLERGTVATVLAAKDRRMAGMTAPAYGLCMDWISYDPVPDSLRAGIPEE